MHFLTCSAISKPRCFALRRFRFLVTVFRIPFLVYSEPFVYSRHFSLWPCDSINIADKMIKGSTGNHTTPSVQFVSDIFQSCFCCASIVDIFQTLLTDIGQNSQFIFFSQHLRPFITDHGMELIL